MISYDDMARFYEVRQYLKRCQTQRAQQGGRLPSKNGVSVVASAWKISEAYQITYHLQRMYLLWLLRRYDSKVKPARADVV